jgi:hypothetical protein
MLHLLPLLSVFIFQPKSEEENFQKNIILTNFKGAIMVFSFSFFLNFFTKRKSAKTITMR